MSAPRTLFEKIWSRHVVTEGPGGQSLLYIDRHLLHDGSFGAFERLAAAGRRPRRPALASATADHYVPTAPGGIALTEPEMREKVEAITRNTRRARASPSSAPATRARASCTWSAPSRG